MTQPLTPDTTLRLTRVFEALRERVFRAFLEAEAMRVWFCPEGFSFERIAVDRATRRPKDFVMVHEATGERYSFDLRYTVVTPPERIEWISTWGHGFPEPGRQIRTTIEFQAVAGGTRVTLTQDGFAGRETRDDHAGGWSSGFDKLTRYLAAER
jgi:uncharacterized protein YndB with AHSA1/START domain